MQENSRYSVGIDIGTTTVRCVVGHVDPTTGTPTIVGVGQSASSGMRKGCIINLNGPAQAIDNALGEAERMSGYEVNAATVSVNGSHIVSTQADGMIAVGMMDHEINTDDLRRIEEVATTGKIPPNREILEIIPVTYRLDGQDNIKDPLGMNGSRLEVVANVVSALGPHVANTRKVSEMATVAPKHVVASVIAGSKAVLNERQIESGVAVIDMGGSTTGVAVYEEGELQYVGVVPLGGINITNDLAIGLKTDPEIAEKIKLDYASLDTNDTKTMVEIEHDKQTHAFDRGEIDEIIAARLEEIFEGVQAELKRSGRAGQLPSGVVLIGGTSKLPEAVDSARQQLGVAVRVGKPTGFAGISEQVDEPQFATAVGLMLIDSEESATQARTASKGGSAGNAKGAFSKFLGRFKA